LNGDDEYKINFVFKDILGDEKSIPKKIEI
jgi:hypothetical protein